MRPKKSENDTAATIFRGIILFAGLIVAGFYGMRDQWLASVVGLLAAGLAFFSKWQGRRW